MCGIENNTKELDLDKGRDLPERILLLPTDTSEKHKGPHAYSDKACREPGLLILIPAPPPVFVRGFQDLDDIPGLEAQFLVVHGHMIPESFCADHAAIADQLQQRQEDRLNAEKRQDGKGAAVWALLVTLTSPSSCSDTW